VTQPSLAQAPGRALSGLGGFSADPLSRSQTQRPGTRKYGASLTLSGRDGGHRGSRPSRTVLSPYYLWLFDSAYRGETSKEHQGFRQRRYPGSSGRTSHPPRDPVFRARLCAPEKCVTAVRSGSPGRGSLSLRYRWAQQARCAIRRPPSPCLRSRIPRPCAHRSRVAPPPRAFQSPSLPGGGEDFSRVAGSFLPTPSVTPKEPHPTLFKRRSLGVRPAFRM